VPVCDAALNSRQRYSPSHAPHAMTAQFCRHLHVNVKRRRCRRYSRCITAVIIACVPIPFSPLHRYIHLFIPLILHIENGGEMSSQIALLIGHITVLYRDADLPVSPPVPTDSLAADIRRRQQRRQSISLQRTIPVTVYRRRLGRVNTFLSDL